MTERECCAQCGRSLATVAADAIERTRESTGFGAANDRLRRFCSVQCKARYIDADARLLETQQATLTLYADADVDVDSADAVTYAVA